MESTRYAPPGGACLRVIVVGVALAIGCSEEPPHPASVVWEGEYLEFAPTDASEPFCEGALEYMDAFVGSVADEMGLTLGEKIRYYHLSDEEMEDLGFCLTTAGCAYKRFTYSSGEVNTHEIVHAIRSPATGLPGVPGLRFYEEGLAELYSRDPLTTVTLDFDAGLEAVQNLDVDEIANYYGLAGDFTRYLVHLYGVRTVSDFVSATETIDELDTQFISFFGESRETLERQFVEEFPGPCTGLARTRNVVECSQAPLELGPFGIQERWSMSCDDPEVVRDAGRATRSFTFELEERLPMTFQHELSSDGEECATGAFDYEVVSCDDGCFGDINLRKGSLDSPLFEEFEIGPGRYLVRLSQSGDAVGPACVHVFARE